MPRLGQVEQEKWKKELNSHLEDFFIPKSEKQQDLAIRDMFTALSKKELERYRSITPAVHVLLKDWMATERKAGEAGNELRSHLAEMYQALDIKKDVPEKLTIEEFRDAVQIVWFSLKGYTEALDAGCPEDITRYRDYYEQIFLESDYQKVLKAEKEKKDEDFYLDEDGDKNYYMDENLNQEFKEKQLPAARKRLEENLGRRAIYVVASGVKSQQLVLQELMEAYSHEFGLKLRGPMEAMLKDYNTVVEDSTAYTPDMYKALKAGYAELTGISPEKAEERFPGEGSVEDFLVGAHELWAFFRCFTEEHRDEKSYYYGSREKYYEDIFAPGFAAIRERLKEEQNVPEVIELRKNLAAYLIPEDKAAQDASLDAMQPLLELLYVDNSEGYIQTTKKVLGEYNRIAGAPAGEEDFQDKEHEKLYNDLYWLYKTVMLEKNGTWNASQQFPKETRSRENFIQNVQRLYVYLKAVTEKTDKAEKKEDVMLAAFTEDVFQKVQFDKYYEELKKAPKQNAPKQNAPKQNAPKPNEPKPEEQNAAKQRLLENLIPDGPEKQQLEFAEIMQTVRKSFLAKGTKEKDLTYSVRQCLQTYNQILTDKKRPQRAELDQMYQKLFMLNDQLKLNDKVSWDAQFPEEKRSPEDYMLHMQRTWVFLKGYAEACRQKEEYLEEPFLYIDRDFKELDFYNTYKQAVADDILGQVEEQQQEKAPLKLADKLKRISEEIPEFLKKTKEITEQSREKHNAMKGAAGVDTKVKEPREIKENLIKINQLLEESTKQTKELGKRRKVLQGLLANQKKLGMIGALKGDPYQKTTELLVKTDQLEKDWSVSQVEAIFAKRKLQGTDLETAFVSFEAAAAEKLKVMSGHAQEFGRIQEAVAAYQQAGFAGEKKCAGDLYRACREYLNAHTADGDAQYEIGGQGTDAGRLRKQAVVRLLEIMEKKAESQPEFEAARESYKTYYQEHHNGKECPKLEVDALKASLARNTKAEIRVEYNPDKAVVSGSALTDKKAYAELDAVREKYVRRQQEKSRQQSAKAAREQQKAQQQRAKAARQQANRP